MKANQNNRKPLETSTPKEKNTVSLFFQVIHPEALGCDFGIHQKKK
jgi:hypothetical protein